MFGVVLGILYVLHVIVAVFLVLVVLLQQGKGADLSVFGGGSTQAAFGARGAATLLHKLTVAGFVLFTLTTLTISMMKSHQIRHSVTSGLEAAAPATPVPAPAAAVTPPATTPDAGSAPPATPPAGDSAPAATPESPSPGPENP